MLTGVRPILLIAAALALSDAAPAVAPPAARANPPKLALPVACAIGEACAIQQYVDHDPGAGATDYRCGTQSYDGHDGTDIRVATVAAARRGVNVLAAAPGLVRGVRDGMADSGIAWADPAAIAGRECGNGVVIAHAGGWETQYCHMAAGSIAVHEGQTIATGAVLGRVGMSGDAQFPHVHFSVRDGARKVDPFAAALAGRCGPATLSLWTPAAAAALAYRRSLVLNAGFTTTPVEMPAIEAESLARPTREGAALVTWVRAISLHAGDVLALRLGGPDGAIMAESTQPPLDHDKAQWLMFTGRNRQGERWPAGRYVAEFTVIAAGEAVLVKRFEIIL